VGGSAAAAGAGDEVIRWFRDRRPGPFRDVGPIKFAGGPQPPACGCRPFQVPPHFRGEFDVRPFNLIGPTSRIPAARVPQLQEMSDPSATLSK